MKRIRVDRISSSMLRASPVSRSAAATARLAHQSRSSLSSRSLLCSQVRHQSTAAVEVDTPVEVSETNAARPTLPSPHPDRALRSAKLAALHARLSLSSKIPLQTLARCLVDPSADAHPQYNNANLAYVGSTVIQYHTSEWLVSQYPRLPMTILFGAMRGYAGQTSLQQIARAWGVERAVAPGEEVDPGLLQFSEENPTVMMSKWGYQRAESKELLKYKWRRGMSSRILYDDAFGDMVTGDQQPASEDGLTVSDSKNTKDMMVEDPVKNAYANMVRAVVGAIYLHRGRDAAHDFVKAHVLSRRLDLSNLFEFKLPTRELARLCAREDFDAPVARLLSETGRMSRTPVFVVGIYSGRDKLGEGTGPSLDSARVAAAINALKSWYLYSPGDGVAVPSDMFKEGAAPWKPAYVDIGEIIS